MPIISSSEWFDRQRDELPFGYTLSFSGKQNWFDEALVFLPVSDAMPNLLRDNLLQSICILRAKMQYFTQHKKNADKSKWVALLTWHWCDWFRRIFDWGLERDLLGAQIDAT